jgi:hypothetical protein
MTALSSLAILGTRSFTIPIHTTGTIPTAIILIVTDTVALAAAAFVAVAFAAVAFAAVAFAAVAFAAVAFAAVGDPYNQPVYQGSAGYTDQLVEQFSSVWLVQTVIMVRSMACWGRLLTTMGLG